MKEIGENLISRHDEGATLGSMVVDPSCIDTVFALVSVNDFAFPEHQIIFRAVQRLQSNNGKSIDGLLLRDELVARGELEKVGGVEYIGKILDSVPSAANAGFYAKSVKEKSRRRRLCRAIERMRDIAEGNEPTGELIYQIQQLAAGLDGAVEGGGNTRPVTVCLADVEPLPILWLWTDRIPAGMLTDLIGDGGLGKTFLALYMAAKISGGGVWPDCDSRAAKGGVIILTAEDDLARVVRPRLDALGADLSKIIALEAVNVRDDDGNERREHFNLQDDLPALRQAVHQQGDTKLIVIDPLSAYLGGKVDSHRDSDVRSVLAPLAQLAEDSGAAVLSIRHLNKNLGGKAIYRGLGSVAFTAAPRTVWLVSKDPNDPDSKRRLLTAAKYNILVEPTGLAFEIIDGKVVFETEPVEMTSDEALGQSSTVEAVEKDRAVAWLREVLPPGTSLASTEVSEEAKKQGFSASTLSRAKREVGATSYQVRIGEKSQWMVHIGSQQR